MPATLCQRGEPRRFGTYDMGFADLAALMEFQANNPTLRQARRRHDGVQQHTGAVMALKNRASRACRPDRQELGAPVFDAGRRGFRSSRKPTTSQRDLVSMDPPLRETMLARGDVDAITGFAFTSLLNLEARRQGEISWSALPEARREAVRQRDHRLSKLIKEPGCNQGVPRGIQQRREGSCGRSDAAVAYVKQRDGIIDEASRSAGCAWPWPIRSPRGCPGRGLRRRQGATSRADGEPGVGRLQHQDAREG